MYKLAAFCYAVRALQAVVNQGASGAFIEVTNDDPSSPVMISIDSVTLVRQRGIPNDRSLPDTSYSHNDIIYGEQIAEATLETLNALTYMVQERSGKPILAISYDKGLSHSSHLSSEESIAFADVDSWNAELEQRGNDLLQRLLDFQEAKTKRVPGALDHLMHGKNSFDDICTDAIDWLGGSIPSNPDDHIEPIKGGCPHNHLLCVKHVHKAHFTKHFPIGIIHFHWKDAFKGVITHLIRDLHCHAAVKHVEVDKPTEAQPSWSQPGDDNTCPNLPQSESSRSHNNYSLSNDACSSYQWHLREVNVNDAWRNMRSASQNPLKMLIIDSGVDMNHPDLKSNLFHSRGDVGVSVINDEEGPQDELGHGTHCAGIAVGVVNNRIGIAGVSNNAIQSYACKFLSKHTGQTTDAIKCVDLAVDMQVDIISASWGGEARLQAMTDAIQAAGRSDILFVCAAGNYGWDLNEGYEFWPACERIPHLIAVAASTRNREVAQYSNYGDRCIDVIAPGSRIYSTLPKGNYGIKSGTSMATPLVAGIAALVKRANPQLKATQIAEILTKSVNKVSSLSGKARSGGIIDASKAVGSAASASFVSVLPSDGMRPDSDTVRLDGGRVMTIQPSETLTLPVFPNHALSSTIQTKPTFYDLRLDLSASPIYNDRPLYDHSYTYPVKVRLSF